MGGWNGLRVNAIFVRSRRAALVAAASILSVCVCVREKLRYGQNASVFRCFRPLSPTSSPLLCLTLSIFFFLSLLSSPPFFSLFLSHLFSSFPSVLPFSLFSSPLLFLFHPFLIPSSSQTSSLNFQPLLCMTEKKKKRILQHPPCKGARWKSGIFLIALDFQKPQN